MNRRPPAQQPASSTEARPIEPLTLAHQKADFTAEGAPPPGRVGKGVPRRSPSSSPSKRASAALPGPATRLVR